MFTPATMHTPPGNLTDFISEIAPALETVYGGAAARYYQQVAPQGLTATICRADVRVWGLACGGDIVAMLFTRQDGPRTVVFFAHVLEQFRAHGAGKVLLRWVLDTLADEASSIYTDYMPFARLELDQVYMEYGFSRVMRQVMRRSAAAPGPSSISCELRRPKPQEFDVLAEVLVATYEDHPEQHLFLEVQTRERALAYLARAVSGHFGDYTDGYLIGAWQGEHCAGLAVGCEVFPGVGFVLHLAVRPPFQCLGMGTALLTGLCGAFSDRGLNYTALGVTCNNPALALYERAGFSSVMKLPVYYRNAK